MEQRESLQKDAATKIEVAHLIIDCVERLRPGTLRELVCYLRDKLPCFAD
jgi:hypothetical protein